jgi:hypothetical protein
MNIFMPIIEQANLQGNKKLPNQKFILRFALSVKDFDKKGVINGEDFHCPLLGFSDSKFR